MTIPEVVFSGGLTLAIPLALLAGLVSFASPCILPLVPGYLGYVGGMGQEASRRRLLAGAGFFVAGFSVVFVAYGTLFGALGAWLLRYQDALIRVMGVLVLVMGLVFVGQIGPLQRVVRPAWTPQIGVLGAPMLGVVFGLGWAPCLGPTLVAISALSIDAASAPRGALLGLAYCIGLGVPFLLIAWGFGWAQRSTNFLRRHLRTINITGGVVLVLIGLAMVSGAWSLLMMTMQGWVRGFVTPI